MSFPVEVIEKILLKCDGLTLLRAKHVNSLWRTLSDYIIQVSKLFIIYFILLYIADDLVSIY